MNRKLGLNTGVATFGLAALLACSAVVGCGGGGNKAGSGSSSGSSSGVGSGATSGVGSGVTSGVGSGVTSGVGSGAMSGSTSGATSGMAMQPCAAPTFTPAAGTVAAGSNVVITAAGGGTIYFTTDGSTPTDASPVYNNGATGVQVTGTTETFQAIASGTTCSDSAVAMATYTITPATAGTPTTPTFTPSGTMTTQNNDFTVTLASSAGATICYALGATAPTCTATGGCGTGAMTYATATPISITAASVTAGQVTVQAIACAADGTPSTVATQQYTLQAATPTMTPAPGAQTYGATLMGALATTTTGTGVTIDYTTNGTPPSCATPVAAQMTYAAPFALTSGTYNAIACKTGYLASAVLGPLTSHRQPDAPDDHAGGRSPHRKRDAYREQCGQPGHVVGLLFDLRHGSGVRRGWRLHRRDAAPHGQHDHRPHRR